MRDLNRNLMLSDLTVAATHYSKQTKYRQRFSTPITKPHEWSSCGLRRTTWFNGIYLPNRSHTIPIRLLPSLMVFADILFDHILVLQWLKAGQKGYINATAQVKIETKLEEYANANPKKSCA